MKDSSVAPVFLFDPARQRRLIDGFVGRVSDSRTEHRRLLTDQSAHHTDLERQLAEQLATVKLNCLQDRQSTLRQWDDEQEKAIIAYETASIQTRDQLLRTRIKYRKASTDQTTVIQGKYEKRLIAIEHQYKQRKIQPKKQQAADSQLLDEALTAGNKDLEWSRALTVRRLDRLLDVTFPKNPYEEFNESEPETVRDAVDLIARQNRRIKAVTVDMQSGFASKVVDSFYLPGAVAMFITIGGFIMLAVRPQPLIWWLLGLVAVAGTLGFLIYAALLFPLRKMTRRLHPLAERIRHTAEIAADRARGISKRHAEHAAQELRDRRQAHLAEAERWKRDQIADMQQKLDIAQKAEQSKLQAQVDRIDAQFRSGFATLQRTMRERADSIATTITQTLHQSNEAADQTLARTQQQHQHTLASLSARLESGLRRGMNRIQAATDLVQCRFPPWEHVVTSPADTLGAIDFLPLGQLRLGQRLKTRFDDALGYTHQGDAPSEADILSKINIPETMPLVIHRRCHSGVLIEVPPQQLDEGIAIAHQVLWRLLSTAAPGRAKVTLIDANSRGQHFASFMALADHDPSLIHHRVWTTSDKITQRLTELTHHVENVLQASLRDRFERIEDYNEVAGSLAEPYHAIAAVGFPDGLSRESYMHLKSLIQSGTRCGVFVILVIEQGKTWPADMPPIDSDKLLRLEYRDDQWHCDSEGIDDLDFWPAPPPPAEDREPLIRRIGRGSLEAARVVVELESLLPGGHVPTGDETGSTDEGVAITIGSQGAGRTRRLLLGEGVRQHVLIAGKTGSGKSTLLHSIITAGAAQYTPDQLQFYLLDFKKGVEFKVYADRGLPHARVIGIESEREFGRSVLQRLDAELASRGEAFRVAGVQELGEFRARQPAQSMPRIMLVIDEFQELFTRDDSLAADCTALLDRLVRQGRSFGIHVVLSSQSLAGANSLPRATLGQMAVRVAMQCSEADAAMILADDNTAARLLSRPGEAIYNDASGLLEGNHPFQVAWLGPQEHAAMLEEIATRDVAFGRSLGPSIVFEGNRPSQFTAALARAAMASLSAADKVAGLLGEAVELGPPTTLRFQSDTGRSAVVVAPPKMRVSILSTFIASAVAHTPALSIVLFDGSRADDGPSIADWLSTTGIPAQIVRHRDSAAKMIALAKVVEARIATESGREIESAPTTSSDHDRFVGSFSLDAPTNDLDGQSTANDDSGAAPPVAEPETAADDGATMLVVIDALDRLRDLRQSESLDFSLDASHKQSGSKAFQTLLRDGPTVGVFVIVTLPSAEVFTRWLPRQSQNDLELRLIGPINAADSSLLIDSPVASELSPATMILYDDADGRTTKFRICDPPTLDEMNALQAP
ncbi:FtsK/SpoIIIE domain-containing protein [Allorhodopirellula heiligendammensis]|uniref:FtsK-like domain-containing protein n=1 Tax=Allorhodopirellula heiligendammensis TaxID=2714739 RepID=A0A5C6BXH1_9BACT|nr:FtsK/SpoIIIE domain-containing protein [Allorhodopirellula heiligendammensis]TWU16171.1 FtsK-like domain-containing protein [Allorhodopirellula heiligendammensis]